MTRTFVFIFCLLTAAACTKPAKLDDQLLGTWSMEKVLEYGNDVSKKHNPNKNRWIEFNADGTFVSGGNPDEHNTGKWTIDHANSILFIDSDMEDDNSEWYITMEGDLTTWKGIGHPRKENTTLIYKRK